MLQIQGKLWEQRTADPSSALKEPFQIHFSLLLEPNLLKTSIIHILFFLFWIKFLSLLLLAGPDDTRVS